VRMMALSFHCVGSPPKMSACLAERHFNLPASNKEGDDLVGSRSVLVLINAWVPAPVGSRTSTQRIGFGGVPRRYHKPYLT